MKRYTNGKIKKAGKILIDNIEDSESLEILSSWRTSHAKPLEDAFALLEKSSKKIDNMAIIAKRLKRTPSIVNKLRLLKNKLQLTTMNDIGGCRVIVRTSKHAEKLARVIKKSTPFKLRKNYIKHPRDSGYRSIHFIGKFKNEFGELRNIELQIRTRVQHSWATAVEIVDIFTNQSIKSNIGDEDWSNFFKATSEQFVLFDENPNLLKESSGEIELRFLQEYLGQFASFYKNNSSFKEGVSTVALLCEKLSILEKFQMFAKSLEVTTVQIERNPSEGYYLVFIDFDGNKTYSINLSFLKKKR